MKRNIIRQEPKTIHVHVELPLKFRENILALSDNTTLSKKQLYTYAMMYGLLNMESMDAQLFADLYPEI